MIVAACGGKVTPRPGESAESVACRSIDLGSSCSKGESCTFDAEPCTPNARVCTDGEWKEAVTMSCNPPPPR